MCNDKAFTIQTTLKWIPYAALYIHTYLLLLRQVDIIEQKNENDINIIDTTKLEGIMALRSTSFAILLFLIQHPLFIASRIVVWLFISILCLNCYCIEGEH